MNDRIQTTPWRGPLRPRQARLTASSLSTLLVLGGLLIWPPARATGQIFQITQVTNMTVPVGTPITIPITITNTTGGNSELTWSLNSNPTTDASITPTNTAPQGSTTFSWTPTQAQPGEIFTVSAIQLTPYYFNTMTFTVTVTNSGPVAGAPSLAPISDQSDGANTPLTFYTYATNNDNSTNYIQFSLSSGPTNATISNLGQVGTITNATATNGIFQGSFNWTPDSTQFGLNTFTLVASETNVNPVLSASENFTVNVFLTNNCPQYGDLLAAVEQGGEVDFTNCPTLVLTNTLIITNEVTIVAETNVTITGNNLVRLFTVRRGGSLTLSGTTLTNLTLTGGRSGSGGAIYVMAGGTCVLTNCILAGNSAVGANGLNGINGPDDPNFGRNGSDGTAGQSAVGGALCNLGLLQVYDCEFLTNSATGGSGGNGGNGGSGSYQSGNGGRAGSGAPACGGAIYNFGTLVLSGDVFSGNAVTGGNGGEGGEVGTNGAFSGYAGNGGSGAAAAGGALCSALCRGQQVTIESCTFANNTVLGGSSQMGGEAGGGYGVNGANGGNGYGGGVCLVGGGYLADSAFWTNTATGGNGGNGGTGNYSGGSGGNGGNALGGCLYKDGSVSVGNCAFSGCVEIGGTNGVGGGGLFTGRSGAVGFGNLAGTTNLSLGAYPAILQPANILVADNGNVSIATTPDGTQPQVGAAAPNEAPASVAAAPASPPANTPAKDSVGPSATPATGPGGIPPALPAAKIDPAASGGNPAAPGSAAPVGTNAPGEEMLQEGMINFQGADLNQVLEIYSMLVNRTILRQATLPAAPIVLKTQGQLTVREGIQALDAVLALNGITMVNVGEKFVKAVVEAQGNTTGAPFNTNSASSLPEMGQYITHVLQLKYAKPSELVPVLQGFVKIPNAILPIDSCQMLVLRDYAENVKRMLEMVEKIDVAIPSEYVQEVIPIKYGKAADIAGALNSLSSGGGGTSVGGSTSSSRGGGSSRMSGMNRTGTSTTPGGYPGATTPGMMTPPGSAGAPGMTGNTAAGGGAGNTFTQRLQNIINRASATGEIQVLGQTKIISDERTNSLLIFASKADMKMIKDIIAKLDVVLAQVLIEAAIISVDVTDSRTLGVSYLQHPQSSGQWTGVGAINNNGFLQPGNFALSGATNSSGSIPSGFSYLSSFGQDLDVSLAAAAQNSHTRILQRPRIQTSHNEPASLFVGTTQPYPTSSYYGGGAYGGYASIQQIQVGVSIDVTPLINPDGLVVMDIHTKIDNVTGTVNIDNVGDVPITSSKEAQAKVSVRDHDTIILGGLIYNEKDRSASGVPFLMDLPLLGHLFRNSSANGERSELLVLIRPTVLPTPEIAALTAEAEKHKMPGVRGLEKEIRNDDARRLKQADQQEKQD
jgi:general secretion pathway protein D